MGLEFYFQPRGHMFFSRYTLHAPFGSRTWARELLENMFSQMPNTVGGHWIERPGFFSSSFDVAVEAATQDEADSWIDALDDSVEAAA